MLCVTGGRDGLESKEGGERVILFWRDVVPTEISHKNTMTPKVRGPDHWILNVAMQLNAESCYLKRIYISLPRALK